jgi:hypothetical protein
MQLLGVSPERIRFGSETVLTVEGSNLRTSIRIDLDSTKSPQLGQFVAWVGDLGPLASVTPVDGQRMQILVPGTLGLGMHALIVKETLSGGTARMANAVQVFDDNGEPEDGAEALPDAGGEAATIPDSAIVEAKDAGVDQPGPISFSGDADVPADATPGQCAGAAHGGVCWYLGEAGATCEQTCGPHGGSAPEALGFVGTVAQGGSSAQCAEILGLLGHGQAVIEASRVDVGIGCHLWGAEEQAFWLTAPDLSPAAASSAARIVCGCEA